MVRNFILGFFILVLLPFGLMAEWVKIDHNKSSNTPPEVYIVSEDDNSITIKVDIAGFEMSELLSGSQTFQKIDLFSEAFTTETGSPEVPYIAKVLAIPDHAVLSVEVVETGESYSFENILLPPARQNWLEGTPEPPYEKDGKAYLSNDIFPQSVAGFDPPAVFRDFRIARVSVYPVRYIPGKKELLVTNSVTVKINFGTKGEIINPKTATTKEIAPSFGKLYRSFIFNYQEVLNKKFGGKETGHELMLCIMPDENVASFQIYADWKRQSGTDIHITKFSDIGANATNPDIIKNHISDAYFNWEVPPTYVLLVGDDGIFPKKIVTYPDYSFPNEDYFVEVEGNDYFPEMMVGRFTHESDYKMQVMINKFLLYEKTPYTTETAWFKKGVCCANNEYISAVETKRFAAELMFEGGFTAVDTLMSDGNSWGYGCTVELDDIIASINSGRSILNYRGEGWDDGWHANCYEFNANDVSGLANGQKFTFVTSIGCGVAMFNSTLSNCFGEAWMELGSMSSPRGSIAFIGPTSNTHTTNNNKIDKGIYVGMFREGMDTPGQALLRGKLYMYHVFGNGYDTEYHYKIYCILGDPSIHIWKDVPHAVDVDHVSAISVGFNQLEFTVTNAANGQPVPNAELCLTDDEIFLTGISDAQGKVYVEFTPLQTGTLMVTVRGGNVIPYQGTIAVNQDLQAVEPPSEPVFTELTGNMDGLFNPNENFNAVVTLKNWGSQTAGNVTATLTSTTPDLVQVITTTPVSFGNITPGGTYTGSPFQFFIKTNSPIGQTAVLKFHITSSTSAWDYFYHFDVAGCNLTLKSRLVNDIDLPNSNFRLDAGDLARLIFTIENSGLDQAPSVMGILSTTDPYITLEDSFAVFGTMAPGAQATNYENNFEVLVSSSCPSQHLANCLLKLYTMNGNYPYEADIAIQIPVSLPVSTDFTGPDTYGYYAYSSSDPYFDQSPVYNWFEIEGLGTSVSFPDTSDYTLTVNLPFNFKYYGGTPFNTLRISTDGWIAPGSGSQVNPINNVLPFNDNVNGMIAPFWTDLLHGEALAGKLLYYNDAANHRFIIEWDSIGHNLAPIEENREVFQVILFDPAYYQTPTGDGEILFQYKMVEATDSLTIGIENPAQNAGIQYVYNMTFNPTASAIGNGFAIKFTTKPPTVSTLITGIPGEDDPGLTDNETFRLDQNRPNPFTNSTTISYSLPIESQVKLEIYNINGERVLTLQDQKQPAGSFSIGWNGLDGNGNQVTSGVYFYRLQTDSTVQTRKMFRLK